MNELTLWIYAKILNYLESREGCTILSRKETNESVRAIITDSLGFRYEIELKCLGRLQTENLDKLA